MSATTHPIDLEPIATAPKDGRAFDAVIDQRAVLVRVLLGRWQWKVETTWENIPEGKEPTHWIKGSVGRHNQDGKASK